MKSGINVVFLALSVACSGMTYSALAATSAAKQPVEMKAATQPVTAQKESSPEAAAQSPNGKVSINSASAEELAHALNGVGLKKAQAIVSYREEYGPFKTLDDLRQVPGMGGSLVEKNLSHLML